MLPKKVN